MDEQMFCFQCEQAAGCTACTGAAGVCGKSAETAAAQDWLTGALIAFAGQLIAAGRGPAPEQARLLMQGLFTTITNVNFDPRPWGSSSTWSTGRRSGWPPAAPPAARPAARRRTMT